MNQKFFKRKMGKSLELTNGIEIVERQFDILYDNSI